MLKKRLGIVIAVVVLGLALAVRVALFWESCANNPAIDDECITALQAKQIARGEFSLLMLAQPYLFPLEAYVMAPIIEFLPRTAFGVRVMAFGIGLLTVLVGWLILRSWGRFPDIWPGVVLLLFGSPFLLIMQYGLVLPGYPSLIFLAILMVWIAQVSNKSKSTPVWGALSAGVLGGLACSVTFLAFPILVMVGAMIGLHRTWRTARWTIPLFAAGTGAGLIPYFLAKFIYAGANGDVLRLVPWDVAWGRLISPTLSYTLPAAMGMGCPLVQGSSDRIDSFSAFDLAYGLLWFVCLIMVSFKAMGAMWIRWRRERWVSLDAGLVFSGVSWICLFMFIFSSRSASNTYRYLTLIILAWPFLVGYYYCHSGKIGRWITAGLTLLFLAINLFNYDGILKRWSDPEFGVKLGKHDLAPAIKYLDERGIKHAYSVYADAYRLTFATDERIICAQLYNERFPSWPLPYKMDVVDPSTNVAYVLSRDNRFNSNSFEQDMASAKVTCQARKCGAYTVYTDFVSSSGPRETKSVLFSKVDASHSPENATRLLNTPEVYWRSEGFHQEPGMWISAEWLEPRQVSHIIMNHGGFAQDCPDTVKVYYSANGTWIPFPNPIPCLPTPFSFINGHPTYRRALTSVELPAPVVTTGIKLEVVKPRLRRAWTLYEIFVIP